MGSYGAAAPSARPALLSAVALASGGGSYQSRLKCRGARKGAGAEDCVPSMLGRGRRVALRDRVGDGRDQHAVHSTPGRYARRLEAVGLWSRALDRHARTVSRDEGRAPLHEPEALQPVRAPAALVSGSARTIVFFPEGAFGPTNNCVGIGDVLRRRGPQPRGPVDPPARARPGSRAKRGAHPRSADLGRPSVAAVIGDGPVSDAPPDFRYGPAGNRGATSNYDHWHDHR